MAKGASQFLLFFFFFSLFSCCSSTTRHDMMNPPSTIFPTNPTTTPPVTIPPVVITPTNPGSTPITIPSTTPGTLPPNAPITTPGSVTAPGGGAPLPVTNPVTTPAGNFPTVGPPAVTNAPAIPGQSWCVARSGAYEAALQAALDYACGIGGTDCSQIQQGEGCYNPNTLQNHASYAFNSYYQKNPSPLSCDFGGTAIIVSTNPSSGTCIYPLVSSSSPTPIGTTPTPSTQTLTPPTTTTTPTGGGLFGSANPPPVFNPANPISDTPVNPASGTTTFNGFDGPPTANTSTPSVSTCLQCFIGCVTLVTYIVAGILVLGM